MNDEPTTPPPERIMTPEAVAASAKQVADMLAALEAKGLGGPLRPGDVNEAKWRTPPDLRVVPDA